MIINILLKRRRRKFWTEPVKNTLPKSKNCVAMTVSLTVTLSGGKTPYFYGCIKKLFFCFQMVFPVLMFVMLLYYLCVYFCSNCLLFVSLLYMALALFRNIVTTSCFIPATDLPYLCSCLLQHFIENKTRR